MISFAFRPSSRPTKSLRIRHPHGSPAYELHYCLLGYRLKNPLQNDQINLFVTERETQLIAEFFARPISLIEEIPYSLCPSATANMTVRHSGRLSHRGLYCLRLHESRPAHQMSVFRDSLLLEYPSFAYIQPHYVENPILASKIAANIRLTSKLVIVEQEVESNLQSKSDPKWQ